MLIFEPVYLILNFLSVAKTLLKTKIAWLFCWLNLGLLKMFLNLTIKEVIFNGIQELQQKRGDCMQESFKLNPYEKFNPIANFQLLGIYVNNNSLFYWD